MTGQLIETPYLARQGRLAKILQSAGLDALALNPGPTLKYLTGLGFHLMERPTVVLFVPGQAPFIVLPELELRKLDNLPYPIQSYSYGDNPQTWAAAFQKALQATGLNGKRIGVEPLRMRVLELRFLEAAAPQAQFVSAADALTSIRITKDLGEIAAMRKAVAIAQKALEETLPTIRLGQTERQVASQLVLALLRNGSDSEMPFAPIVSSGPNSANPHASPSDKVLAEGELLVIDWGATYQGYISDLTRTFALGRIEPELGRIAKVVAEANAAGRGAARPGIRAGDVDKAARRVINESGYGSYFTHRTGHGIGMEGHEEPYMYGENDLILTPGMAFTVEPGIYLPNRNGVRIEDNVVITMDGAETLSDLPRELIIIGV